LAEAAESFYFVRCSKAFETLGHEEAPLATPDQLGHSLWAKQTRSASVSEPIAAALDQGDESITLKDKMGGELSCRQKLDSVIHKFLKNFFHDRDGLHFVAAEILFVEILQ
jgi:hypothetical protein